MIVVEIRNILIASALVGISTVCVSQPPAGERALCPGEEASLSPDGKTLLFQRFVDGFFRVGRRDIATGGETWLRTDDGNALQPVWLSDGHIVYTWGHMPETAFAAVTAKRKDGYNLWLWADGTNRPLTSGFQRDYSAGASQDGRTVFYATTQGAAAREFPGQFVNASYLYATDLEGNARSLYEPKPTGAVSSGIASPRLSPDGRVLVWSEVRAFHATWRLVAARPEALCRNMPLTPTTMCASAPAWSPDGRHLAFTGFTPGDPGWCVYLMHVRTGTMRRVADGRNPSFSPDGQTLIYDRDEMIYARTLAAADWPVPAAKPTEEPEDLSDALTIHARVRYRSSKGLAFVARIAYPEHPLGMQLFFRDGTLEFATRRPDGSYTFVRGNHAFKDGEEEDIVAVRTRTRLILKTGGKIDEHTNDDGFLPLSPEPAKVEKGIGFKGDVLSFALTRGSTDEIEPPLTRAELFKEVTE